eukprot:6410856-Prymnesium_polylepis.1
MSTSRSEDVVPLTSREVRREKPVTRGRMRCRLASGRTIRALTLWLKTRGDWSTCTYTNVHLRHYAPLAAP